MASNVNVKFVAILSAVLLLLATVVAGSAYVMLKKSGADHVAAGDQFVAAGDYAEAAKSYAKAVNKEQTNVAYLEKWQDALLHTIPDTDLEYSQAYSEHYLGILRRLAALQSAVPEAQRKMLDALYEQIRLGGGSAEAWTNFLNTCNSSFENLNPEDTESKKLLRYRGFARVALMPLVANTTEEHDQGIEDLETAIKADPSDIEAQIQLAMLYRNDWISALNANRPTQIQIATQNYKNAIDAMRADFGNDPRFLAAELDYQIESKLRLDPTLAGQQRIRRQLRGVEEPLVECFLTCDTDLLTTELLASTLSYGRALWNVRSDDYNDIGIQITDRVIEARPDDFDLIFFRGAQFLLAERFEDAKAAFQKAIDSPDLPISLAGLRLKSVRINAVFQLATTALAEWEKLPPGPEKDAALAEARTYSERLNDRLSGDNQMSLLIAGQIAMAEHRNSDAVTLLQRLNTMNNGTNVTVIRLLATALAAQGTLGAAVDQYDNWILLDPNNPVPMVESAQIYLKLRNPEEAIARLEAASTLVPENDELKKQINTLRISTGTAAEGLVAQDPVIASLVRAEALAKNGDGGLAEALEILDELTGANPDDPRPLSMQIEYLARSGDTDRALAVARHGLELLPSNEAFNRYVAMLSSGDRTQILEQYIDNNDDPEPVRLIQKYALNVQLDDLDRAQTFLDQAASRFPNHPAVLDALFLKEIQKDDLTEARRIAATAASVNADQCDGLLYQARLSIKEEDFNAALNSLQIAVEKAPFSPQAWRLFGQVLLRAGRIEEAVNSLAKAHEYKPTDIEIAKTYASTLIQLQRLPQALEVIRSARRFSTTDADVNEIWLSLESQVGDPSVAIDHRKSIYESDPDDANNTRQLISLLTAESRFNEAEELIEASMRPEESDLGLIVIQARWHAKQGNVDSGAALIRSYIDDLPPAEVTEIPYLALGNFLVDNGRNAEAIAAFEEGAKHQSPDIMASDRRLGDYYFNHADYENALAAYRRVTNGGADSSGLVAKRIIETLQRLKRWDDAESALNTLTAGSGDDMQTMLLRTDIANGRGDIRSARELVNRAVEMAPNKPEPYIRRAQLDFDDPERLSFVLSDLDQAIRLMPNSVQPRRMRADALIRNRRSAEAIAELRRGIEAIPDSSELRRSLIQELWQSGRHDEAHAEAEKAIAANPENSAWLMVAGDIASRDENMRDHWEKARDYFEKAYALDPSIGLALRLANACLYLANPDPDAAIEALKKQGDGFENDSQILILRARAINLKGNHEEAVYLAERSIAQAQNVGELRHWFLHMEVIFDDNAEMIAFVDRMKSSERLMPAYIVHAAAFRAFDLNNHKKIIQDLRASEAAVQEFARQDGNNTTLVAMYRVLGQLEYGQQMYAEAADSFAKGAALMPDDMEFNNNLAYTRAKHLNDLEGALAPAERAVFLSPANSPALDTLGWIYYRLGRLGQAKQRLTRAMANAVSPLEKGGAYLHMAQVLLAEGDRPEARKYAELANDIIKANPNLGTEFDKEFNELMTQLQEAENTQ